LILQDFGEYVNGVVVRLKHTTPSWPGLHKLIVKFKAIKLFNNFYFSLWLSLKKYTKCAKWNSSWCKLNRENIKKISLIFLFLSILTILTHCIICELSRTTTHRN
jgi:hypothetical protein